ncbi:protein phosphatase 2C domain-containing protein [Streptomyces sp. NPDC053755]|uniref:PP2C family serine/threonine-protein phosphatase n=1 Tax=Streptomyces sp. NPDC053755 TaxID=3155815 RepID=UPI0034403BA4
MSQKPQRQLSACPGCAEPLESGDRFCGACGHDLTAVPAPLPGADRPTMAIGTPVDWPEAPPRDPYALSTSTQHPGDLPGRDSGGHDLTEETPPHGTPGRETPARAAAAPGPAPASGPAAGQQNAPGQPPAQAPEAGRVPAYAPGQPSGQAPAPGHAPVHAPKQAPAPAQAPPPLPGQAPQAGQAPVPAPGQPPEAGHVPAARDLPTIPVRTDGPHAAATSGDGLAALAGGAPAPRPTPPAPSSVSASADGDFPLAAPDPRAAAAQPAAPPVPPMPPVPPTPAQAPAPQPAAGPPAPARAAAGGKVCVACRAGRVDPDGYCENCGHAQPRERDHMEQELSTVAAVSDRGLRHHRNEDAFSVSVTALPDGSPATVAVVCDGVSSATRPDEASAAAADAAGRSLLDALPRGTHPQQAMHEAIVAAAEAVNALAEQPGRDAMEHDPHRHQNAPACTIVSAVVADGLLVVGWVGDSRAYWVPDDRGAPPARLTQDDSWAAQMVAAGLMNEAEAYADERAHAITGWLGADAYELEPHTAAFKPDRPGVVVVCTDGLWNYAEAAEEMARVVPPDSAGRLLHGAQVLVGHALDGGGHDNVTVALLPFGLAPRGAGSA